MKVDIEKNGDNKVKLKVSLDANEFSRYYEEELNKIVANVEIKGFRKGKVPRDLYLRRFGEAKVLQQAFDRALSDSYYKAVEDNNIEVIASPKIDIDYDAYAKNKSFGYSAEVEVYPEVKLGQYFEIEIEKESTEVTAKDVDDYIYGVRKSKSDLEIMETPLEKGNVAIFDFEGFVDGKPLPEGKAENYQLEIGGNEFIPGFEDQMIGMKPGERKTINVTFPDDYSAESLRGKKADFKIVLHEVKKRVLPELNDEFVKAMDIEEAKTVESYRRFIEDKIRVEKKELSENKFEQDLLKRVCENAEVTVPEVMVQRKIDYIIEHEKERAKSYNLNFEQFLAYQGMNLEKYKKTIAEPAKFDVLNELVLNKIIETEKIDLSTDDYEKGYQQIAKRSQMSIDDVKKQFPVDQITYYFLLEKTVDLLKEKAIIKE